MSINSISPAASLLPSTGDEVLPEDVAKPGMLSYEERHKNLVETNTRYIWDQMTRSTQHFTQEMIRQVREREKEDERNER